MTKINSRLKKLEKRSAKLCHEPLVFEISFVSTDGEIVETLILGPNGERRWEKPK